MAPKRPDTINIPSERDNGRPRLLHLSETVGLDGKIHRGEYSSSPLTLPPFSPAPPARLFPSPSEVDIRILVSETGAGAGKDERNKEWSGGPAASRDVLASDIAPHPSAASSILSHSSL